MRRVIQDAETIRKSNKICNVRFVELEDEKKVDMIFQDIKNQKFFAIIDNNMISGQSTNTNFLKQSVDLYFKSS